VSPRPRTASDEDLLNATYRVVMRLGPHLTLTDVAKEAGVSAATLVQRFGSKRGLLLKFAALGGTGTDEEFAAIRQAHPDPLDATREVVRCYARMAPTPAAVSNGLAFLQVDLSDPEFHRFALAQARARLLELKKLLDAAVKAGRLARCDTTRLASALDAVIRGAMVAWAVLRKGTAEQVMIEAVETLLEPRITGRKRKSRREESTARARRT